MTFFAPSSSRAQMKDHKSEDELSQTNASKEEQILVYVRSSEKLDSQIKAKEAYMRKG